MRTPQELQAELDGIPDPPDVSDLLSGSGVLPVSLSMPCSEVDCEELAAMLGLLQDWLDQARERLDALKGYTQRSDLQRIRNEALSGRNEAEGNLGENESDGSGYQLVIDAVNEKFQLADDRYEELLGKQVVEVKTKKTLLKTQNHCCVESVWWNPLTW